MGLRIMLLGLVVGMGAELPSADRFESWASQGRQFAASVWGEIQSLRNGSDASPAEAAQIEARQLAARADRSFEKAMDAVATDFAADLAMLAKADEPLKNEIAQLDAEGVEAPTAVEVAADADFPDGPDAMDVASVDEVSEPDAELDQDEERLTSAVRLTRDAVGAWIDLLKSPSASR